MIRKLLTYSKFILILLLLVLINSQNAFSQKAKQRRLGIKKDTTVINSEVLPPDSIAMHNSRELEKLKAPIDTAALVKRSDSVPADKRVIKKTFIPDSRKAVWVALVIPGGGQIYNRKYWKLPIIYGGFMGCAYALNWNNKMYKDYSQAYLDIMDDDANTNSFNDFLPPNYNITGQEDRFKEIFRKRKDIYRRQRDLSIFAFIGVYLLSVIDAYVDAELSDFDISKDIGMKIEPAIFNNDRKGNNFNAVGLQCSIKF